MNTPIHLKWDPLKVTILLSIFDPIINASIISYAAENGYVAKPEFHVSIIGFQNGKKIIEKHGNDESIIDRVRSLADNFSWEIEYLPEYFTIEKYYDEVELAKSGYENVPTQLRRTIIQKVLLPNIETFYRQLSVLTGLDFEIPFSHITLFAWSDYIPMMTQGIGLYSEGDFQKYSKERLSV